MTTLKPLPSSKPKKPVYFNEIVQVYDFVRIKAKGEHNPSDALEELKKQLDKKKTIKSALKAKEEALHFKKKGAAGKSLPLKQVPYSAIKAFYQFSGNPTFMVMGVHGKEIPKQYIILATSSPGKTNKLFEVLQMAQWAPANNLKNEVPAVVIDERLIVENTSKSSGTPVKTPTTESRTSSRTSSSLSSSTRPPLVQSKARSSSDSTFRARSNSSSSHTEKREQRKRSSPLRSSKIESNRDKSNSSACQIPVENGDSKSSYFFYEPRRPHSKGGQRSRRSTRSATYLASSESSSDSRSKGDVKNAKPQLPVGGVLLMTGLKPDKFGRIKSRASSESRLASKIYYVQPGANKTSSDSGSSSDSQNETIFVIKSGRASKAGASH